VGCSTTQPKFVNTWKAPEAAPLSVKKGDLVVAMVISTRRRRGGQART